MSYYVTITRKPSPYWESGAEISEAEWREAALAQPGFRPPTELEKAAAAERGATGGGTELVWTGHPAWPEVWFDWQQGQVDVRNPDEIVLGLMARLAAQLNAQLLGEQGERFDAAGNSLGVEDFPEEPGKKRPWWRRLFAGGTGGT